MDLHELKISLQEHFTDGLVIVIGSGLSAAVGLPTMWHLSNRLVETMRMRVNTSPHALRTWMKVEERLVANDNLEKVIADFERTIDRVKNESEKLILTNIIKVVAQYILEEETKALNKVFSSEAELALSKIFKHFTFNNKSLPINTSNYDRLIEFAAELQGLSVNNSFAGRHFGRFDLRSKQELPQQIKIGSSGKNPQLVYDNHIQIFKPHGSLGWYLHEGKPICSYTYSNDEPLIITPGVSKYIKGYELPFDKHREGANNAIDRAARFLIIGYGFNDYHLETHLRPKLGEGRPCVILTRGLTESAEKIVKGFSSVKALTRSEYGTGTTLHTQQETHFFSDTNLWDLSHFVKEVLE